MSPPFDSKSAAGWTVAFPEAAWPEVPAGVGEQTLCKRHLLGRCLWGDHCPQAHSQNELSERRGLWKTRWCVKFMHGGCKANAACPFAHGLQELRSPCLLYKSRQHAEARPAMVGVGRSVDLACKQMPKACAADDGKDGSPVQRRSASKMRSHKVKVGHLLVNPHDIFFSNPRIIDRFSCGRTVESTIQGLQSGHVAVADIPPIRIVRREGQLQTLDHRRLFAFRAALPIDALIPAKLILSEHFAQMQVPLDCKPKRSVSVEHTLPSVCAGSSPQSSGSLASLGEHRKTRGHDQLGTSVSCVTLQLELACSGPQKKV